jgi:cardiolipin synthase A/B
MFDSSVWIAIDWVYAFTIVIVIALIILENKSPEKTVSWILILILLPLVGVVFYFFFGQDYRKKKIFSRKGLKSSERMLILEGKLLNQLRGNSSAQFENYHDSSLGIMKMLFANSNSIVTENNHIRFLIDGKQTFDSILESIRNAKHHIHLEFYIIAHDKLGATVIEALCQKAQSGVKVRILYDDVGSWKLREKTIKWMRQYGIEIYSFQKIHFPFLSSKVNYRNHRKLVVIDGKIGYTGGFNIADRYIEGDPELGYWRDTFVKIEGEAVWGIQNIFAADWFFTTKENITSLEYYPLCSQSGNNTVQIVSSGPDSDWPSILQFYFAAISQAQEQVYITSPYFLPTDDIMTALKTASLRGVDVQIIIPGKSDSLVSHLGTESLIGEMIEAGIQIFRYTKGFIHSKTMVVDHEIVSVGSANMDFRSLETNFEINAVFYNKDKASEMIGVFRADLLKCVPIIHDEWRNRPLLRRFITSLARIVSPLM